MQATDHSFEHIGEVIGRSTTGRWRRRHELGEERDGFP
jgi:hypothetical protein